MASSIAGLPLGVFVPRTYFPALECKIRALTFEPPDGADVA